MRFCFPSKFPSYRKENSDFEWFQFSITLPFIFKGIEYQMIGYNDVWKIYAPTEIKYEKNEYWHSFKISFLGFGLSYSRQWGY